MAEQKKPPTPKPDVIGPYLEKHLKLQLTRGNFTDPNNRTIQLVLKGEVISEVSFDVVQKREYEG